MNFIVAPLLSLALVAPETARAPVSVEDEPRHHAPSLAEVAGRILEMENERARIYRLVLAPGQSTEEHSHALHSLGVVLTEGIRNVGSATFEAVEIELKDAKETS
jgi:quercetin dioxygenase-like cupin family protein